MPGHIHSPGKIGIVYSYFRHCLQISTNNQSWFRTVIVCWDTIGTHFVDSLELLIKDKETEGIILIGG